MKQNYGQAYTAPLFFWITFFFAIPISIIILFSFMQKGLYGGVEYHFSLEGYRGLANPEFLKIVGATLFISIFATVLSVLIAIPTAYFMARNKYKRALLFLIIIPFWTNFLIRIYAWIAILGNNGLINNWLMKFGLIDSYLPLLYNKWAVIIVLVYVYLPFAILPLYSTIEKFDFQLLEASRDLGATKFQSHIKILIPNIRPGITTAVLFTFIPAFGNYAVPQIVGGADSLMVGNVIAREVTVTRNWPLASSISMVLTVITTIGVVIFLKLNSSKTDTLRKIKEDDL